jgi:hypothetical protein
MSLEVRTIMHLGEQATHALLTRAVDAEHHLSVVTFDGFPTAMVFRPTRVHPGSLHYMFFPSRAAQTFHYHPGGRYLLLVGDVPMEVHHSEAGPEENPYDSEETVVLPPFVISGIRFPAQYWHSFQTLHDDDDIDDPDTVADDLMEEKTVFWESPET